MFFPANYKSQLRYVFYHSPYYSYPLSRAPYTAGFAFSVEGGLCGISVKAIKTLEMHMEYLLNVDADHQLDYTEFFSERMKPVPMYWKIQDIHSDLETVKQEISTENLKKKEFWKK